MSLVEQLTRAAVHRRDHQHGDRHPCGHAVEVISLGAQDFAACHDCGWDSPLLDPASARAAGQGHCC